MGLGHLRAHGPPHGGPWRQWPGRAGGDAVFETHGPLGPGTCVPDARMVRVIACWAEGIGRRGTARVVEGGPNTVLPWWVEAAARCRACADDVRHDGSPRPGHWDARDAVRSAINDGEVSEDEAIERFSRAPHRVWVAMEPETTRLLSIDGDARTLAMAQCFVHQVALL